jgi:hypothetical protein
MGQWGDWMKRKAAGLDPEPSTNEFRGTAGDWVTSAGAGSPGRILDDGEEAQRAYTLALEGGMPEVPFQKDTMEIGSSPPRIAIPGLERLRERIDALGVENRGLGERVERALDLAERSRVDADRERNARLDVERELGETRIALRDARSYMDLWMERARRAERELQEGERPTDHPPDIEERMSRLEAAIAKAREEEA